MSSLLQRLAAQAMGKTNTIRPLSRSRYAASLPPENITDLDQHIHTLATGMQPDHEQFHPEQRETAARSKSFVYPHVENGIRSHVEAPPAPLESVVTHPAVDSVTTVIRNARFSSADHTASDAASTSVSPPSRQALPVSEKAITKFFTESEQSGTDDAISYSPATHTARSIHHVRFTENDTAPSLLPLTKPAQTVVRNTPGMMQKDYSGRLVPTGQSRERREETTEVHVHIGRIEVRATAVAAPARKTFARSPMMSLDDYLKQRNGGER